ECPRCGSTVYARRPQSASRCAALLLAAALLYVPANLLPVSVLASLQGSESDTIFGGIVLLWQGGSWPLALLVLVASIVVPMAKLVVLSYLLLAVRLGWQRGRTRRARLYRALVAIGRWSMLDIYVVALLAALVRIPALAAITPGPGAIAFGAVVVLTMLATHAFDPRLIWDAPRRR
ncbi:MAG: paraquat-inducible protein A, partial [Burkholderiales bacterium]|nr:paraquat-inducible protein A [Burkholderiales bacterium]